MRCEYCASTGLLVVLREEKQREEGREAKEGEMNQSLL